MQVFPRSGTEFIICDTTNPPTDNVLVRQALSMAIERDTLANGVLKGEFSPRRHDAAAGHPGLQPRRRAWRGRRTRRRQLLAEAGFPNGEGFPELKLDLRCRPRPTGKKSAAVSARRLEADLGIDVKLDPLEDKAWQDWFNSLDDQPFNL